LVWLSTVISEVIDHLYRQFVTEISVVNIDVNSQIITF